MSKLYDKYLYLKKLDNSKIYLIKSGIFYIALEDDALELSEKFNFKLTNLNDKITKCGFPESRIKYYTNLLDIMNIKYEIINLDNNTTLQNNIECNNSNNTSFKSILDLVEKISSLDMDDISFKKSFEILGQLNHDAKNILSNYKNNL